MYFSWHKIGALSVFSLSFVCFPVAADTFAVDTTADADLSACTASPNDCSLRGAINRANTNTGLDTIRFAIPGAGIKKIAPTLPLPIITDDSTIIDGSSQIGPGASPLISLSGESIPPNSLPNGLTIQSENCTIRKLNLHGWFRAILIRGAAAQSNTIEGCYIGTDPTGLQVPQAKNVIGIHLTDGANVNQIGGSAAQRNIIAANSGTNNLGFASCGIYVSGGDGSYVDNNFVIGNYIGTNRHGQALGEENQRNGYGVFVNGAANLSLEGNLISANRLAGIRLNNAQNNRITRNIIGLSADGTALGNGSFGDGSGGDGIQITSSSTQAGGPSSLNLIGRGMDGRNIISGHSGNGIELSGSGVRDNYIETNFIGTDLTGKKAIGNSTGVLIEKGAADNTIGDIYDTGHNIISGNTVGIALYNFASAFNIIQSNYIGLDVSGTLAIPNRVGIDVQEASTNHIGPGEGGTRNVISGNETYNIRVRGVGGNAYTSIMGNFIGTTAQGDKALGNYTSGAGILIQGTSGADIGFESVKDRNIISGHAGHGIMLLDCSNTYIQGNFIGTDGRGQSRVPNGKDGIFISDSARDNSIGGPGVSRNIISGNTGNGITISGPDSNDNRIAGNFIGLNARGDGVLGNGTGIYIGANAPKCIIGSPDIALRNVISGNGNGASNSGGVVIEGTGNAAHTIINCYIGTDATGLKSGFGNNGPGVLLIGAQGNRIGVPGAPRNVISGNGSSGIVIRGVQSDNNQIQNNYIGTDQSGTKILQNVGSGIEISDGASATVIGGNTWAARNLISGNRVAGITLRGRGGDTPSANDTVQNIIQGNFIGTDASGAIALRNVIRGISIENAPFNSIGGTTPGARNLISGNLQAGIFISGANAQNNLIRGNFIGTDVRGAQAVPNTGEGIALMMTNNIVGGLTSRPGTGAGNLISGNGKAGIFINTPTNNENPNRILGNLIGTNLTSTSALPNLNGIQIYSALNTAIGNGQATGRNIISGNSLAGVFIGEHGVALSTRIQGNYIGTDISGLKALSNTYGVANYGGLYTVIGGATTRPGSGSGNVISGNAGGGVFFSFVPVISVVGQDCQVFGNAIGVNSDGLTPLPNRAVGSEERRAGHGIYINDFPGITVGAPGPFANLIAYNEGNGVHLQGGLRASNLRVQGNSIFANGGLGIDLNGDGVTPNDARDEDVIANSGQNFPVINSATQSAPNAPLVLQGTLDSTPNFRFVIDVYASDAPDPSGHGEGQMYLGSFDVNARQGATAFSHALDVQADLSGKFITTTATILLVNETSEFSQVVAVNAAPIVTDNTAVDEPSQ
jgi:CSLREA domain-containing protein